MKTDTHEIAAPIFGDVLRDARLAEGLTVRALAQRTGITFQSISRLECSERAARWDTVWRLVIAGGLDLAHFFPADVILAAADRIRAR